MNLPGLRPGPLGRTGLAALVAASILSTAFRPPAARPAAENLPTLRLSYFAGGNPKPAFPLSASLDPAFPFGPIATDVIALTNAGLAQILPNGRVAPDLAHWTISKNHLVYTFTIWKNARFSNGHPVTAADAAFSIRRTLTTGPAEGNTDPGALIRGAVDYEQGKTKTLSGVRVIGLRVLRITLIHPAAYFLAVFAGNGWFDVLDPTVVKAGALCCPPAAKHNQLTTTCTANQGAGPFKFACRNGSATPSSFYPPGHTPTYTLVPNPYYYGPRPRIRLELPQLKYDYKSYLEGKLDATPLQPVYLSQWKGKSSQYHQYPTSEVDYLYPNVHMAPFDNVHCRLAVAYALDRTTIASKVLGGAARPTYAIVPKRMLGYYDGKDNPHFSQARARAELARCPSRTTPFAVTYPQGVAARFDNELAAIESMLSGIGMNARLKPVSGNEWAGTVLPQPLDKTNTQMVYDDYFEDFPDPSDYFANIVPPGRDAAIGGWYNREYERLVNRAAMTLNQKKRASLYIQAQHLAISQGALIPVSEGIASFLIKPYVRGLELSQDLNLVARDNDWSSVSVGKH